MSEFASLLRCADALSKLESDPIAESWWSGYMRGLVRAHHGESFGTDAEHEMWIAVADSADPQRAALGRGYVAGLKLEARDPD